MEGFIQLVKEIRDAVRSLCKLVEDAGGTATDALFSGNGKVYR